MGASVSDSFTSSVDSSVSNFALEYQGLNRKAQANISEEAVPYGNYVIIQRGGGGLKQWQVKIYVPDNTNFDTLETQTFEGHVGTLHCFLGDFTVVLKDLSAAEWYPATAEWGATLTLDMNTP